MVAIAAVGEVMLELAPINNCSVGHPLFRLGVAGDTYNTSVYLARLGMQTNYVTLLGDDIYSDEILNRLGEEGIGTHLIERLQGRKPGLYMIKNSISGERQFSYWRNEAPARELFGSDLSTSKIFDQLCNMQAVYLSGITLAIISQSARQQLFSMLALLRKHGVKIIFDSNYRPRLWASQEEAQSAITTIMQFVDIALMTLEDEDMLWQHHSIEAIINHYQLKHTTEWIIKCGAEEVLTCVNDKYLTVPVPHIDKVIDTTGAGDSFNAGYIAARFSGATVGDATRQGIKCAGIIIQQPGAIVSKADFLAKMAYL